MLADRVQKEWSWATFDGEQAGTSESSSDPPTRSSSFLSAEDYEASVSVATEIEFEVESSVHDPSVHFCDELDDMDEYLDSFMDRKTSQPPGFFDRLAHLCSFGSEQNKESELDCHMRSVLRQKPGGASIPQNRACLNLEALGSDCE